MAKTIGDEFRDDFRKEFGELVNELQRAPGETARERVSTVLARRGWDDRLMALSDDRSLHGLVLHSLELLALRRSQPQKTAAQLEAEKRRAEMESAAASGMYGDLFGEQYVNLPLEELARLMPCESYFVESSGEIVPREALVARLDDVGPELLRQSEIQLRKIEALARPYRHEVAIFSEMLRQKKAGREAARDTESVPA